MSQIADKIYKNAKIYSVALDGAETHAEARAVSAILYRIPKRILTKMFLSRCRKN